VKRFGLLSLAVVIAALALLFSSHSSLNPSAPQPRITIEDGRPSDHPIRVAKETLANALAPVLPWLFKPLEVAASVSSVQDGVQVKLANVSSQDAWLKQIEIPLYMARQMSLRPPAGLEPSTTPPVPPSNPSPIPIVVWVGHVLLPARSETHLFIPSASSPRPSGHFEVTMRIQETAAQPAAHSIGIRTTL
jgi:hypothetical protein